MTFFRRSSVLIGRNLLAGAASFLSGWYCRRCLVDATLPGCVEQTAPLSAGTAAGSKAEKEKNGGSAERNQSGSMRETLPKGEKYSGLLVTRRLVVPSKDVAAFAEVLNDFADWNVRQNGFSSQTVYVHEVNDAGTSSFGSSLSERSWPHHHEGVQGSTSTTDAPPRSPAAVAPREGETVGQTGEKEIKALEILTVEEWADPLAARTALTAQEMREKLAEARKKGWDLRGEVWMGMARSPTSEGTRREVGQRT